MNQNRPEQETPDSKAAQGQSEQSPETPLPEKLVGLAGLLLLLATIGFLIYAGLTADGPPALVVEPKEIVRNEAGYLLQIEAINTGGKTAAEVIIEGELFHEVASQPSADDQNGNSTPIETSETTFDFIPHHSTREGALIFQHDPAEYRLELHAKSYVQP